MTFVAAMADSTKFGVVPKSLLGIKLSLPVAGPKSGGPVRGVESLG